MPPPNLIIRPQKGMVHRASYKTDVLSMWDGLENRIAVIGEPRDSYSMDVVLVSDEEVRRSRAEFFLNNDDDTWTARLPLWFEGLAVLNDITGTAVDVDSTFSDWPAAGLEVLVEQIGGDYFIDTIASPGTPGLTTIVLDNGPPAGTWPAGRCRIYPLVTVNLNEGLGFEKWPLNAGGYRIEATRTTFRSVFGTGASLTTFDGLNVLHKRPKVDSTTEEAYLVGVNVLDFGAVHTSTRSRTWPKVRRGHQYVVQSQADRQFFYKFLQAVRGRQKTFLLPTWVHDLLVAVQPTGASLRVKIPPVYQEAGFDYVSFFASEAHKRLQLEMTDGSILYREVSATLDNGDGTRSLTLDASVDTSGANPDVAMVSFLETVRLDSDVIETVWRWGEVRGELSLAAMVVQR